MGKQDRSQAMQKVIKDAGQMIGGEVTEEKMNNLIITLRNDSIHGFNPQELVQDYPEMVKYASTLRGSKRDRYYGRQNKRYSKY